MISYIYIISDFVHKSSDNIALNLIVKDKNRFRKAYCFYVKNAQKN